MKYFHVHVVVEDLAANIKFYSQLFGQPPVKQRPEYAKWMLEDPRVNFAISARGHGAGVNHFGIQSESIEALDELHARAISADSNAVTRQGEATCCYANSRKHWVIDPQGLAWEHFYTRSDSETYGRDTKTPTESACCIPLFIIEEDNVVADEPCCLPNDSTATTGTSCCS